MTRVRHPPRRWTAKAGRVGEALPPERWHPAARAEAGRRRRTGWAVALSGGPDSLALLLALWAHWPERRRRLVVLHFDHRQRGRASAADAAFCVRVARALGLRSVVGRWADAPPGASEAALRAARHAFFRREMRRRRLGVLWLAHQRDDVAETLLMRLARGSGTGGLAAPRPVQAHPGGRVHLRPLLTVPRAEIEAALRAAGVPWRRDPSNAAGRNLRSRVRHALLPLWTRLAGRDVAAGCALARERLDEDDAALEAWVDRTAAVDARRGVLFRRRLDGLPAAVWRRSLHRWLVAVRPDTDLARAGFEDLLAALRRGRDTRFSLGRDAFAVLRRDRLVLERTQRFV